MSILIFAILIVVLDGLFLGVGGLSHSASVWIGFAAVNFALILCPLVSQMNKQTVLTKRTGTMIAYTHLFLQLFVFLILSLWFGILPTPAAVVIHVLVAAGCCVAFLSNHSVGAREAKTEEKTFADINQLRQSQTEVESMWRRCDNEPCKKLLENLSDALRSCQYSTDSSVMTYNKQISDGVDFIRQCMDNADYEKMINAINMCLDTIRQRDNTIRMSR